MLNLKSPREIMRLRISLACTVLIVLLLAITKTYLVDGAIVYFIFTLACDSLIAVAKYYKQESNFLSNAEYVFARYFLLFTFAYNVDKFIHEEKFDKAGLIISILIFASTIIPIALVNQYIDLNWLGDPVFKTFASIIIMLILHIFWGNLLLAIKPKNTEN